MEQQAPLCQTLAEQLREKPQLNLPMEEATTLYQNRTHSGDPAQLLKDLTARQTELLNTNAPEEQRIAVFKEIQKVQKMRRNQN